MGSSQHVPKGAIMHRSQKPLVFRTDKVEFDGVNGTTPVRRWDQAQGSPVEAARVTEVQIKGIAHERLSVKATDSAQGPRM
jgi:hypothetical protein